jgi:hypothetical protein
MSEKELNERVERFEIRLTSSDARSGRPTTVIHAAVKEQIHQNIRDNRRTRNGKVASEVSVMK